MTPDAPKNLVTLKPAAMAAGIIVLLPRVRAAHGCRTACDEPGHGDKAGLTAGPL